jgi:hypothetical protein
VIDAKVVLLAYRANDLARTGRIFLRLSLWQIDGQDQWHAVDTNSRPNHR